MVDLPKEEDVGELENASWQKKTGSDPRQTFFDCQGEKIVFPPSGSGRFSFPPHAPS